MSKEKLSKVKNLSAEEIKIKRARHTTVLRKAIPRVEKLKKKIIKKKGKIKPRIER